MRERVGIVEFRKGLRRAQRCVEWSRSGLVVGGCVAVALPDELHRASMGRIRNWLVSWMLEQGVPRDAATKAKWHARECTRIERMQLNGEVPSQRLA